MENATKENLSTTNVKEMELSFGLTDAVILEDGAVENKMERARTSIKMARKETESGKTVKKCNGSTETMPEVTNNLHETVLSFCF
jgi:hypothetical protein